MWTHRRVGMALLAGTLALTLAACDESATAPTADRAFDAEGVLTDFEALETTLATDGLASFQALTGRTPFGEGTPGAAALRLGSALSTAGASGVGQPYAARLLHRARIARAATRAAGAPVISEGARGTTFVYDPQADRYVAAPERDGAPATGVRFVLYEVDPAGRPVVEREVGYADLIDEGDDSAAAVALRLDVVVDGASVMEYRTTLDGDDGTGTLTVAGFLQDADRLDFDIVAAGSREGGREVVDLDFDLHLDARDFHIEGRVRGLENSTGGEGFVDITLRHGEDTLRLDMTTAGGELTGAVTANGATFATVSGPEDDPTFVSGDGDPLTGTELLVLRHLADAVEDVFDLVEDLVDPVDDVVILGILL